MTFNALMLPELPPTSAAGLKATDNSGPGAAKFSRLGESTRGSRSFMATLNEVSHRQCLSHPESTDTEVVADVSADAGKATPDNAKTCKAGNDSSNPADAAGATCSNAAQSETTNETGSVFSDSLVGYFHPPELGSLMQQSVAAGLGLNTDAFETAGQNAGSFLEANKLIEGFLAKTTIASLARHSDLFENSKLAENAKMAEAGKDAPLPVWKTADPNFEALFNTASRRIPENSQLFKMIAGAKVAAEQSLNSNFVNAGVSIRPAEHDSNIKSAVLKAESLPIAELGSKITRTDGDNKEGSFLLAQGQLAEQLKTLGGAMRTFKGAQRGLTSQPMDQIVQKAVLMLNNDQHEVRIELKPEFLGHIRMQIVTENQQVAVKILTEFPWVKDMLESNLNQLRTQLQAQGLTIDELEVSVAHDSYTDGDTHQADDVAKTPDVRTGADFDDDSSEKPSRSQFQGGSTMAESAIDFFA